MPLLISAFLVGYAMWNQNLLFYISKVKIETIVYRKGKHSAGKPFNA